MKKFCLAAHQVVYAIAEIFCDIKSEIKVVTI
jgi:hypothetical protein